MRLLVIAVVCLSGLLFDNPTATHPNLDGKWKATSGRFNGNEIPAEALPSLSFVIDGDRMWPVKTPDDVATIVFDQTQSPMWFDLVDAKNQVNKGIFRFENNSLTICSAWPNHDRPTKFESVEGTSDFLFTATLAGE